MHFDYESSASPPELIFLNGFTGRKLDNKINESCVITCISAYFIFVYKDSFDIAAEAKDVTVTC